MENERTVWHVWGTYNAARKADYYNGATGLMVTNPHGNVRSIGAELAYRTKGGWLLPVVQGGYASLRTTNYSKVAWSTAIGMGKDFIGDCPNCNGGPISMRLELMYSIPTVCYTQANLHCLITEVDKEQGVLAKYTVPCPCETQRHVFWQVTAFGGIIKTTEHGHYTHDGGSTMGLLFRF